MTCLECGGQLTKKRENYRYLASGLPNVTLLGVEVRRCATCGDHEVVIPGIEALHEALAAAIVRRPSLPLLRCPSTSPRVSEGAGRRWCPWLGLRPGHVASERPWTGRSLPVRKNQ
jgi:hypothetical protein